MSLGITVASLKASVETSEGGQNDQLESWREGKSIYSPYDTELAAMASFFSALPPFMAGIMLRKSSRRRRLLDTLALSFLAILLVPAVAISSNWDYQSDSYNAPGYIVNLPLHDLLVMKLNVMVPFCALILTMLTVWTVLLCRRKKARSAQLQARHSRCMMVSKGLVQVALLVMMIGALIVFFLIRAKIIDAGDDSQLEWSFGQVLSLTTWIPVVVDFIYTICGKLHTSGPILIYQKN